MLPRTIDKLRAELPGGDLGDYLNHDIGFSAYVVRRLGLDMDEFRNAVAEAADETAVRRVAGGAGGSGVRACAQREARNVRRGADEARGSGV